MDYYLVIAILLNLVFYGGIIFIFVKIINKRTIQKSEKIEVKLDRIIELLEQKSEQ